MKRILGLWVCNYYSGSTSERFVKPLKALGYEVDVFGVNEPGVEVKMLLALKEKKYDYLLHVPYPNTVRKEFLNALRSKIKTIAWNGDDEWQWGDQSFHPLPIAMCHDYVVTTSHEAHSKYPNAVNVILGQWGYSAGDWKKGKVKKDIDVYFCGAKNPRRDYYIRFLLDAGIKVYYEGPQYSKKVELKDMIKRYRKAKIGLNFTVGDKNGKTYGQVKARNFEIPAVGTFQLSEDCFELSHYFEDKKEIETFRTGLELVKKVKYFLTHEDKREQIAKKGYERAKKYSYEKIFKQVFGEITRCEAQ